MDHCGRLWSTVADIATLYFSFSIKEIKGTSRFYQKQKKDNPDGPTQFNLAPSDIDKTIGFKLYKIIAINNY